VRYFPQRALREPAPVLSGYYCAAD
jgi:hypothetical protein